MGKFKAFNMNISPDACRETADWLLCAFSWDNSPEGRNYWREVYTKLIEYSEVKDNG